MPSRYEERGRQLQAYQTSTRVSIQQTHPRRPREGLNAIQRQPHESAWIHCDTTYPNTLYQDPPPPYTQIASHPATGENRDTTDNNDIYDNIGQHSTMPTTYTPVEYRNTTTLYNQTTQDMPLQGPSSNTYPQYTRPTEGHTRTSNATYNCNAPGYNSTRLSTTQASYSQVPYTETLPSYNQTSPNNTSSNPGLYYQPLSTHYTSSTGATKGSLSPSILSTNSSSSHSLTPTRSDSYPHSYDTTPYSTTTTTTRQSQDLSHIGSQFYYTSGSRDAYS